MIIVDTSAWIFLFENKKNENSVKAKNFYAAIREPLAVTDLIIEETHKWLIHHGFPEKTAAQVLNKFVHQELAKILEIESRDRVEAAKFIEKYHDQSLSYTDALSVVVMKRNRIKTIFSFDSDFDLFHGIQRVPCTN